MSHSPTQAADDAHLARLTASVHEAHHALLVAIHDLCPGPHQVTQHRDGKPRWCDACGRSADGTRQHP